MPETTSEVESKPPIDVAQKITLQPVTGSTQINAIGYAPAEKLLDVQFSSGVTYRYAGVPLDVAHAFSAAQSKGSFFRTEIKGAPYQYVKLPAPTTTPENQ